MTPNYKKLAFLFILSVSYVVETGKKVDRLTGHGEPKKGEQQGGWTGSGGTWEGRR